MATNIDVIRERTVEHLNSKSVTAKLDQAGAKAVREKKAQLLDFSNWNRATGELRYPSLGGGLLLRPDGSELSGEEHKELLLTAIKQLGFYLRHEIRADGRTRQRRRKTNGVHSLVLTLSPERAMLLEALERNPKTQYLVRPFLIQLARAAGEEFSALTGLEVLTIELHPEEGNLHLHITYATVNRDNRLLWAERTVGRKGLRCLGPWHIGNLRLVLAGHVPKDDATLAVADLKRVERLHGEPPVDWVLAQSIDSHCEHFVERNGLRAAQAEISARYGREVRARRAQRPDQLRAATVKAETERARMAKENAGLREQLRQALAQLPSRNLTHTPDIRREVKRSREVGR